MFAGARHSLNEDGETIDDVLVDLAAVLTHRLEDEDGESREDPWPL